MTLGARSEHLSLQQAAGDNTLACRVQWVERLGDLTYVYLDGPQQTTLIVRLPGDRTAVVGDGVHLHLPASACHLFDQEGMALPALC